MHHLSSSSSSSSALAPEGLVHKNNIRHPRGHAQGGLSQNGQGRKIKSCYCLFLVLPAGQPTCQPANMHKELLGRKEQVPTDSLVFFFPTVAIGIWWTQDGNQRKWSLGEGERGRLSSTRVKCCWPDFFFPSSFAWLHYLLGKYASIDIYLTTPLIQKVGFDFS